MIANHGQKTRYYHEMVGCNSRLDSMQAAILRIKLRHLDEYCAARRMAADYYDHAFANHPKIRTPYRAPYAYHVFHQYTLQLDGVSRDMVQQKLAERNIPSMIYYPVPCHKQNMLKDFGGAAYQLPVTDMLQDCVISLPIHTELSTEELHYITTNVIEVINQL
jgi:dTDP-4-amino-4,6-dideoxygalactose transaminase